MRVELKNEFMVKGDLIKLASLLAPLGMSFRICYVGNLSKNKCQLIFLLHISKKFLIMQ